MKKAQNKKEKKQKRNPVTKTLTRIFGKEMSNNIVDKTVEAINKILLDKIPKEKLPKWHQICDKADQLMLSGKITPRQSVEMQYNEMKKSGIVQDEGDFIEIWHMIVPEVNTMEDIIAEERDNLLAVNEMDLVGDLKEQLEKQLAAGGKKK